MQRAVVVLLRQDAEVGRWPLVTDGALELDTLERIARTKLAAQRLGCDIRLEQVCPLLRGLLDLVGLELYASRWSGAAKAGNSAAVSRKLWWPTMRSLDSSSTWIDHGKNPPSGSMR